MAFRSAGMRARRCTRSTLHYRERAQTTSRSLSACASLRRAAALGLAAPEVLFKREGIALATTAFCESIVQTRCKYGRGGNAR